MLVSLAIRDVVLIEALDLGLGEGLCVLTGETGAGKSILLDALGLALGARSERGLVRRGARQGTVTASFRLPGGHPVLTLLEEQAIEADDELVLRRVIGADGRSRAFVNEQPVGTALLRRIGELLVEIHGQNEQVGLLNAATHRALLDAYGRNQPLAGRVRAAHGAWMAAERARAEAESALARARAEEDYLRHIVGELEALEPRPGEEDALAEARTRLQNRERLLEAVQEALVLAGGTGGAVERLAAAGRRIERAAPSAGDLLEPAARALERALVEAGEAVAALEEAGRALDGGERRLEEIEERLFALRAAARKHRIAVDELPALLERSRAELDALDRSEGELRDRALAAELARAAFLEEARALSKAREDAALALAEAVAGELAPLRLDRARFRVALEALAEDAFGADGAERIAFEVATNPGEPFGPLARIASGGELARLMLALKVVLARIGSAPTVIFDEIDAGIGGATADAIGERLARLGRDLQVLVVTHAPQVAARAGRHLLVAKRIEGGRAVVAVEALSPEGRREELARMLAGARVTEAARAAAESLIGQAS